MKDLNIEKTENGYMFRFDAEHSALITKIYDNDPEVFHIYTEDGQCFETRRNSKFGQFINKTLRKEKLKRIDGGLL